MAVDRSLRAGAVLFMTATLLAACGGHGDNGFLPIVAQEQVREVKTLSNRADLISGGDALAEIVLKQGQEASKVKVTLNGADVTSMFAIRADGRYKGMVTGLVTGTNQLVAKYDGGPATALAITNHPIGGPVFSGPQVTPWICETSSFGLGQAVDPQCNAPSQVTYYYRSTDPTKTALLPYNTQSKPNDVSSTTTDTGLTVPFIVRLEVGAANRGIYALAFLADPEKNYSPLNPPATWNGALLYVFQGGALPQYRQGPIDANKLSGYDNPKDAVLLAPSASNGLDLSVLGRGYAVVNNTLNLFAQNTNTVTSAETAVMMKEKVAETLGEIKYTLSIGGSGGSMQQHLLLNTYPGIFDGAMPGASYPDIWSTNTEVQDCSLLARYFDGNPSAWSNTAMQNAVFNNSNVLPGTCRAWLNVHRLDSAWNNPSSGSCFTANPTLSDPNPPKQSWEYDPIANPGGARCTLQDYQVSVFGKRPDGFAERPYDNIGVQYGLSALKAGSITAEQFVDMNEKVGGRDIDWNWTASRSEATSTSLERVYRTGQYNLFDNAATTPMIDIRGCNNTEIHSCYQSFKTRQRIKDAIGSNATSIVYLNAPASASMLPFLTMEKWVKGIKADSAAGTLAEKVVRNKPADAVDSCWINGNRVTDMTVCLADPSNQIAGEPRGAAGAPISAPAAKCTLAPLDRNGYGVAFTDPQWSRLQAAFPQGICDWSKRGVGQSAAATWLSYADGAGGQPLPSAPTSR